MTMTRCLIWKPSQTQKTTPKAITKGAYGLLMLKMNQTVARTPRSYPGSTGASLAHLLTLTWTQKLLKLTILLPKLVLAKTTYLEPKYMILAAPNISHPTMMLSKIMLISPQSLSVLLINN